MTTSHESSPHRRGFIWLISIVLTQRRFFLLLSPRFFLSLGKFVKMATKRKFMSENSGALVPVKKPKQHEIALANQGGAIQAVFINMISFFICFDVAVFTVVFSTCLLECLPCR